MLLKVESVADFHIHDVVMVEWDDGNMYEATILESNGNNLLGDTLLYYVYYRLYRKTEGKRSE